MSRLAKVEMYHLTGGISIDVAVNSNSLVSDRLNVVSDLRFDVGIVGWI